MKIKVLALNIVAFVFISGCSATFQSYYQTLSYAFSPPIIKQPTLEQIKSSEVDLISVKYGDRPSVIMALAFIEQEQHKWVSSDHAVLVMEKGRVVRTLGLKSDLLFVSNLHQDPLKSLASLPKQKLSPWQTIIDLNNGMFGVEIQSTIQTPIIEKLSELNLQLDTWHYQEEFEYLSDSAFKDLEPQWTNHYWLAANGQQIKSVQKLSPFTEHIQITYLSRIARLKPQSLDH
ncbi:YjbF family lipoprotein [Paraglaciecola aestuariivivens]